MKITEQRLFEIILEEVEENYSAAAGANLRAAALTGNRDSPKTVPVDDDVIRAIVAATSDKKLNEEMLTEDMKQRRHLTCQPNHECAASIKRVGSKPLGVSIISVMLLWMKPQCLVQCGFISLRWCPQISLLTAQCCR